ncbi:uncharacterized protein PFL1_02771 [Pseudozyma flocculosa PF-1]|uniref:Uncharacterized protein n=2 Tax=Pseudozyma flocculosa TaxID=84751 RepID=A0A5C3F2I7_9BASI|nr:uncharacterized protein PFL1_02771 [Pseudozyma flocculosa PF-1]EPQ29552.1 hypothetical protein PFL1_02771 [Pseudozyma flocculosa PF-1]SPO38096.1 uncharacterized protein PSFLO_03573 [Pseudozyma flocculosa]
MSNQAGTSSSSPLSSFSAAPQQHTESTGSITPLVSATQRLNALYALTTGESTALLPPRSTPSGEATPTATGMWMGSATRRLSSIESQLAHIVSGDRALRRFLHDWQKTSSLLNLGFYAADVNASTMAYDAQLALCLEMEPDLVKALADLQEVQELNRRNVVDARALDQCEKLAPRLVNLLNLDAEEEKAFANRQKRAWQIVERYHSFINTLSQLFITLDQQLAHLESAVAKEERRRDDRPAPVLPI